MIERVVKAVRHTTPVFGAGLIGAATGIALVGMQLPTDCALITAGSACETARWASVWSTRSVVGGAGLIGVAMVSEWYLDEDSEVSSV